MKKISIVTACYNEQENVEELYRQVKKVFSEKLPDYEYDHLFIDNCSQDSTVSILKGLAAEDRRVKIIVNSRNYGHIRSPYHGLVQADGDAVISIVADLQDPPEMIVDFVRKWEQGNDIVVAIKNKSMENKLMYAIRTMYYRVLKQMSDVNIFENFTGFGLYDKRIIRILREINDPYPFFRGIISELGFKVATVNYTQPRRERGITKNNFFTLYDMGILGIISNSKVPLRIATFFGFILSFVSFLVGLGFFVGKILFWSNFQAGIAPMLIGNFFLFGVLLFFIGLLGEYVGAIYTAGIGKTQGIRAGTNQFRWKRLKRMRLPSMKLAGQSRQIAALRWTSRSVFDRVHLAITRCPVSDLRHFSGQTKELLV